MFFAEPVNPPWNFPPEGHFASLHVALQFPPVRIMEFCVGIMAGKLFLFRRIRSSTAIEFLTLFLLLIFYHTAESMRSWLASAGFSHWGIWYNQCGGACFFAFMIYVFAHQQGLISSALQLRPLVFMGKISFVTYLLHVPILALVIKSGIMDITPKPVYMVAGIATVYTASWLGWRFVEMPAQTFIKKFRWERARW